MEQLILVPNLASKCTQTCITVGKPEYTLEIRIFFYKTTCKMIVYLYFIHYFLFVFYLMILNKCIMLTWIYAFCKIAVRANKIL